MRVWNLAVAMGGLVCVLGSITPAGSTVSVQTPDPSLFEVKSIYGPWGLGQGEKVLVGLDYEDGSLNIVQDDSVLASVPIELITEIRYDTVRSNRGHDYMASESSCSGFGCLGEGLVVLTLLFFEQADHFVSIAWSEGTGREAEFEVDKGSYREFLDSTSSLVGIEWRNVPAEREELKADAVEVRLDREVWWLGRRLERRTYKMIPVEAEDGNGSLLIFRNDPFEPSDDRDFYDPLPVRFIREDEGASGWGGEIRVEYRELPPRTKGPALTLISAVRFPEFTVQAADIPAQFAQFVESRELLSSDGDPTLRLNHRNGVTMASLVDFNGEEALRFEVLHRHFDECLGYLYVMKDSIAYDAAHSPRFRENDSFNLPLSEVEIRRHEIRTPDRRFRFREITAEPSGAVREVEDSSLWGLVQMAVVDFESVASQLRHLEPDTVG